MRTSDLNRKTDFTSDNFLSGFVIQNPLHVFPLEHFDVLGMPEANNRMRSLLSLNIILCALSTTVLYASTLDL